jgi:DNA-directed RNA polymerase beta' subunit
MASIDEIHEAIEAANAAKLAALPSKAELVQDAAALRQAQEANRIATAGQVTQQAGQVAAGSAAIEDALKPTGVINQNAYTTPAPAGGIPDLTKGSTEDFQRREREAREVENAMPKKDEKELVKLGKDNVPKAERKGLTNDDYLMMGLGLLASTSSNFGQAVGEAGLGTLKARREREKDEREAENDLIKNKYTAAYTDMLERGGKEKNQVQLAEKTAQEAVDNWAKNNKMALLQTPGLYEQMRNKYRMEAYNEYGIPMQNAAGATGAPTARTGWGVATAS